MIDEDRLWILWAKQQTEELNNDEQAELRRLMEQLPPEARPTATTGDVWNLPLKPYPDEILPVTTWQRIAQVTHSSKAVTRRLGSAYRAAAAIAVLLMLAAGIGYYELVRKQQNQFSQKLNQVITEPDSKSQVELPDGTTVWLNRQSTLTYNNEGFGTGHREVTLVGEAFFDVKRNESVPFIINTSDIRIKVKGTAFNVKSYPDAKLVETSLVRGLIEITTRKDPDRTILLRPNEKFTLNRKEETSPNNRNIVHDSAAFISYTVTRLKNSQGTEPAETAWMKQRLVYNDETFEELAPKLESWYNIRIVFQDPRLKKKRFTGVLEKESLDQLLRIMQLSSEFDYTISGDELLLGL